MNEKIILRRIHLGMNKKITNNELNKLMKKLIIEEKYLSEGLILDIENGFIIIIKCDPISGYLTHDTIIYLESTIQPLQRIHFLFNHTNIFQQFFHINKNNINKNNIKKEQMDEESMDEESMEEDLDKIINRNYYYGPFYITSLKNNINTLINPIINPSVTGSGPAATVVPGTSNTNNTTKYTTGPSTVTKGKGANSMPIECTPGKGANFTAIECTEEKISNEIAVVTKSGESDTNSSSTVGIEGAPIGAVGEEGGTAGPSTVTEDTVTEEIYFYEYDENGNEIIIECNGKGYKFFEKLFNLYLKELLEIPRIFYYGNKHIIGHFNFIISSIIPFNKPGYINPSTEIYFGMDPYEYFDEVIVNPLIDTIPKNYNYDLLKDVKSYFSLNPFKIFRLGDVFTFSGVQFRITHVSKNNTILPNCPKYARINHLTNIIIGEMVKPKVMDLLPIEQVNILRFSAPCYREKLLSQFADNLDPISLDRIQNTINSNNSSINTINSSRSIRSMDSIRSTTSSLSSIRSNINIDGGSVSSNINTSVTVTGTTESTTDSTSKVINSTKDTKGTSSVGTEEDPFEDAVGPSTVTDVTEDKLCSVCYEIMLKNENIISLRCGHIFHEECVNRWLIDKNSCPYCRTLIINQNHYNDLSNQNHYNDLSNSNDTSNSNDSNDLSNSNDSNDSSNSSHITNITIDRLYYTITRRIIHHSINNTDDDSTQDTNSTQDSIDTDTNTTEEDTDTTEDTDNTTTTTTTTDIENNSILEILKNLSKLVLKSDFKLEQSRIFNACQQYLIFLNNNRLNNIQ
uniref:RING-type E3 ubiquitin transferase n=1 Tax=Theileria annulata TaxID=5874 RepID=A0A3B0MSV8_THEAN